jgi:hypothetical protein
LHSRSLNRNFYSYFSNISSKMRWKVRRHRFKNINQLKTATTNPRRVPLNRIIRYQPQKMQTVDLMLKCLTKSCLSRSALMSLESTMPRICAPVAIANTVAVSLLPNALTTTGFFTLWECARHAISLIITRGEASSPQRRMQSKKRHPTRSDSPYIYIAN